MKTKHWILIFVLLALICTAISVYFFFGMTAAECAYVYSDGKLIMTLPLDENAEYTISFGTDWNIISVKDGEIAVTSSSCASQDCVRHGYADSGAPIVCLPNRLVIEFSAHSSFDAMVG